MEKTNFYFGTQYYRTPHPTKNLWEIDFKTMNDVGIEVIKIWLCWSDVCKKNNSYDYNIFDSIFESASKYNIKILIQFMLDSAPQWVEKKHPDWLCEDKNNNKVFLFAQPALQKGGNPGTCIDNDDANKLIEEFIANTVKRYKDNKYLYGWDLWNEMWRPFCYCRHTESKYQQFLKNKYKEISSLNKIWNRDYEDFTDIKIPKIHSGLLEGIELHEFKRHRAYENLKFRRQTVEKIDNKHVITAHVLVFSVEEEDGDFDEGKGTNFYTESLPEIMKDYLYPFDDDWQIAKNLDFLGATIYLRDLWRVYQRFTSVRSSSKDNIWLLTENTGSSIGLGNLATDTPVEQIKSQNLLAIASGAIGSIFWQFRSEVFGEEAPNYGMISSNGQPRSAIKAVKQLGSLFKNNKDIFSNIKINKPEIAIIWQPDSYIVDKLIYKDKKASTYGPGNLFGYFKAITSLGHDVDFLNSQEILQDNNISSDYKLIIAPYQIINDKKFNDIIKKWVSGGGVFITGPRYGVYNEYFYWNDPVTEDIEDFFGVKYISSIYLKTPGVDLIDVKGAAELFGHEILENYTLINAEPVGIYNNDVCIVKNSYNKGKVYLAGSFFGKAFLLNNDNNFKYFIKSVTEEAKLHLNYSFTNDNNLLIKHCISGNTDLLFCFNSEDRQKSISIKLKEPKRQLKDLEDKIINRIGDRVYSLQFNGHECRVLSF